MKKTLHIYHRSGKACGGFDNPQANMEEPLYSPGLINPESEPKPKPKPPEKPKSPPDDGMLLPPGVE